MRSCWIVLLVLGVLGVAAPASAQLCRVGIGMMPVGTDEPFAVGSDGTQLLITADDNSIYSSLDGENWTPQLTQSGLRSVYNMEWTGQEFVLMRGREILTSPDGENFTSERPNEDFNVVGVAWDGTQTVVAGNFNSALNLSAKPDGGTWSPINYGSPGALGGVIWTGTQFIAGGQDGLILTSPDGLVWTAQDIDTTVAINHLATDGTTTLAFPGSTPFISTDGVTWIEGTHPGISVSEAFYSEHFQKFVAGGINFTTDEAAIAVSDDGMVWQTLDIGVADSQIIELASNGTKTLAVTQRRFQDGPPNRLIEIDECPEFLVFRDGFEDLVIN